MIKLIYYPPTFIKLAQFTYSCVSNPSRFSSHLNNLLKKLLLSSIFASKNRNLPTNFGFRKESNDSLSSFFCHSIRISFVGGFVKMMLFRSKSCIINMVEYLVSNKLYLNKFNIVPFSIFEKIDFS